MGNEKCRLLLLVDCGSLRKLARKIELIVCFKVGGSELDALIPDFCIKIHSHHLSHFPTEFPPLHCILCGQYNALYC